MTELIKRRATFTGIFNRVVEDGDAAYVLIDYEHPKDMRDPKTGKPAKMLDTPVVVSAKHFGPENIVGKVRVTVLIEQQEMGQQDIELLAAVGIAVMPVGDKSDKSKTSGLIVGPDGQDLDSNQGEGE